MRILAIVNQKGGCGKTTTAINLAAVMARSGCRTLLVDLDPQSHCAAGLGIPEARIDLDIGDAMVAAPEANLDTSRLLWRVAKNLDLIPSRMKLAGLEASRGNLADKADRERRLAGVIGRLAGDYDLAIVDCSPAIGLLTFNALTAADAVLIPVETSFFSLQGASKQMQTVATVGKRLGVIVPVWLLPTIHDQESKLASDLLGELRRRFEDRVAPVVIRRDVRLKEAASFGQPIVEYAPESYAATDYGALGAWVDEQVIKQPVGAVRLHDLEHSGTPLNGSAMTHVVESAAGTEVRDELARRVLAGPSGHASEESSGHDVIAGIQGAPWGLPSRAEEIARRAASMTRQTPAQSAWGYQPLRLVQADPPEPAAPGAPNARVKVADRLAGVRFTNRGVLFVQPLSLGERVSVAGDFNGWSAHEHPMRRNEVLGVFETCISLPAGRRLYKLVVDGVWMADRFNPSFEIGPGGDAMSIVQVVEPTLQRQDVTA